MDKIRDYTTDYSDQPQQTLVTNNETADTCVCLLDTGFDLWTVEGVASYQLVDIPCWLVLFTCRRSPTRPHALFRDNAT